VPQPHPYSFPEFADMTFASAWRAALLIAVMPASALAQQPDRWWDPLPQDTAGVAWVGVDASGFASEATLIALDLRRRATPWARGYWSTHLRAGYADAMDLPGTDGESVRASEVYVALLLDCERATWLLAGAYASTTTGRETLLVPLGHAGLEATDVALDRVTRLACVGVRRTQAAERETAPVGAILGDASRR
jgi:hypothetical protein